MTNNSICDNEKRSAIPKAKTGYTVDEVNWYVDVDCTEVAIFTNLQKNITVYAKATANQYTITYNANGGTVTNATKNVTYDAAYILETPTHTESYMRFDGWKDGNGNTIILTGKWTIDSDIVLTAQWTDTRAIFVISFVQAGQETKIFNVKEGESFTDIPTPVQKKGYIVMWDKTEFINVTENITVTAIETAKIYTLILNANGGMVSQATITVTYGQAHELLIPIHTDKMFDCWMLDGVEIADQGIWEIDMAQQELILTAQWGESEWTEDY